LWALGEIGYIAVLNEAESLDASAYSSDIGAGLNGLIVLIYNNKIACCLCILESFESL